MKPVISTVLALYILATALQGAGRVDPSRLVRSLGEAAAQSAQPEDFSEYAAALWNWQTAETAAEGGEEP